MDNAAKLKDAIKKLVDANPNLPIPGIVEKVTGDHCSVKIASGLVLTDVKLKATINDGTDYLILSPKIGSPVVMMSLTGKPDNLTIIKVDQVEKMEYTQNGLTLVADSVDGKLSIKNGDVSLYEIFSSLGTLLRQLKLFTNSGISGLPVPASITAIQEFEDKFKQLLKED